MDAPLQDFGAGVLVDQGGLELALSVGDGQPVYEIRGRHGALLGADGSARKCGDNGENSKSKLPGWAEHCTSITPKSTAFKKQNVLEMQERVL
jgi:hypothetical protein